MFLKDIENIIVLHLTRGYAAAAAIGRLANTSRGVSTKQFLMLYKTHVCAATDYSSHV